MAFTPAPNKSLKELMEQALAIIDPYTSIFVNKIGAPRLIDKGDYDFSTALDIFLERRIAEELTSQTGIEVFGEELGGGDYTCGDVWVIDPIDGTANYSAGLPVAGILLSLIREGIPVIGICSVPVSGHVYTAYTNSPLFVNGIAQPQLSKRTLAGELIGFGSFQVGCEGFYPGEWRAELLNRISQVTSRTRMLGSTGLTTAYVASGALVGAVIFGSNIWDNAAGSVLISAAGGKVTDVLGNPWTIESQGMLVGCPGAYEELAAIIAQCPHNTLADVG